MSQQPADGRNVQDDASSILTAGTLCTIIAGCPENIGLVVKVVSRLGAARGYQDGYRIRTTTGRHFAQLWQGKLAAPGASSEAFTERWKLRPLVRPPQDEATELIATVRTTLAVF